MRRANRSLLPVSVLVLSLTVPSTIPLQAQSFSIGLRGTGGFPTGVFAETDGSTNEALINGAKSGFGYGLDLGVAMGMLGVYAGLDHINFDCEPAVCTKDGKYKLQGVAIGVRLMPMSASRFHPYVKGGVTFNTLEGLYGNAASSKLTTDRAPGYEVGVGGNYSLGGLIAITPQVRYVGQNFKAKIPGVVVPEEKSDGANYFTFDIGLSFTTPFGSKR